MAKEKGKSTEKKVREQSKWKKRRGKAKTAKQREKRQGKENKEQKKCVLVHEHISSLKNWINEKAGGDVFDLS